MAYENKKQPADPAFTGSKKKEQGPKSPEASKVLAGLGNHTLKARWDHPYSETAKHDDAELAMRARQHKKR